MQKWEYLCAQYSEGPHESEWHPISINDQAPSEELVGLNMSDHLNSLGEQGWEVVTMSSHSYGGRAILKRPKKEE